MTRFPLSLRLIILVACSVLPLYIFISMLRADNQAQVVVNGVILLWSLYLYGLAASLMFSGPAAMSVVDFLLYPKRFLKTVPPVLSRQAGLITRKSYKEAELELIKLRQEYKGSPEIALMLADLHADGFNDLEAAVLDCQFYFKHRNWRYNELNLPIVLRYADWQAQQGNIAEALVRLRNELNSAFYPQAEKNSLKARISSLRKQSTKK